MFPLFVVAPPPTIGLALLPPSLPWSGGASPPIPFGGGAFPARSVEKRRCLLLWAGTPLFPLSLHLSDGAFLPLPFWVVVLSPLPLLFWLVVLSPLGGAVTSPFGWWCFSSSSSFSSFWVVVLPFLLL